MDDRRPTDLTASLAQATRTLGELTRLHIALVKAELVSEARRAAADARPLVVAIALGYLGALLALVAGIALWALILPLWAAALVMSALTLALAAVLGARGARRLRRRRGGEGRAGASRSGRPVAPAGRSVTPTPT